MNLAKLGIFGNISSDSLAVKRSSFRKHGCSRNDQRITSSSDIVWFDMEYRYKRVYGSVWGAKRGKRLLVLLPALTPVTATIFAVAVFPHYHCRYCWCCCCSLFWYCCLYSPLLILPLPPRVLSLLLQFVMHTIAGTAAVASGIAFFASQTSLNDIQTLLLPCCW